MWGEPALRATLRMGGRNQAYLVASELHIGLESELSRRGAFLRSRTQKLADHLLDLLVSSRTRRLVLLGDVKHRIGASSAQERRDVPAFFARFSHLDEVRVALGNHDAGLKSLLPPRRFPNVTLHRATGFLVRGDDAAFACLHGHAWPGPGLLRATQFLVGHTHAAAALVDENGKSTTEWAWLRGRLDPAAVQTRYGRRAETPVIVFPPFNPLCGGVPVNRDGLLGPFSRLVDLRSAHLYLLDGRALGAFEPPRKPQRRPPKARRTSRPSDDS